MTPVAIDTWAQPFANLSTLDTAGVAVRTQSYGDVTPLKSAVAITGWCPSLTGTAYMEAASGGSKINGETKFLGNRFNPHLMRIKPADIANDLVISMKIDP